LAVQVVEEITARLPVCAMAQSHISEETTSYQSAICKSNETEISSCFSATCNSQNIQTRASLRVAQASLVFIQSVVCQFVTCAILVYY